MKNLLAGRVRLITAYWVLGVIPAVIYMLLGKLIEGYYLKLLTIPYAQLLIYIYIIFPFIYFPVVYIGIWKSANNYKKNKIWAYLAKLAVIINVVFLALNGVQLIKQFINRDNVINTITQEVTLINRSLPSKIDSETELMKIVFNNNLITYQYRLSNQDKSKINPYLFAKTMKPRLLNLVCNSDDLNAYLSKGINVSYNYVDRDNNQIINFIINPNDCMQKNDVANTRPK